MNSGMSPKLMRSSGITWAISSLGLPRSVERTSAPKPTDFLPTRLPMTSSRPAKAPPQMNSMLVVSICRNS